jgi:predicted AAA+ superfamily ATPase
MELIREFQVELKRRLQQGSPLIQAVVGPRQVGKTTGVLALAAEWPRAKVVESADSLAPLSSEWLASHWQRASELGPGTLLVIDEVQKIPDWSQAVKTLYDRYRHKKLQIVMLGSASFQLQRGLSDSLAGRYELLSAPHWSFSEMNRAFGFSFEQYLSFGGYPGAAHLVSEPQRWRGYILNSILENVLTKDLSDLAEIRNPAMLRQLFFLTMEFPAQEISFQKLVGQLQDKGAVATVKHYLEILESAHLLKLVYKYGGSALSTRTSSPKILPLAPALISALTDRGGQISEQTGAFRPEWRGRIFEAAIGSALRLVSDELYYWRERDQEVDFVVRIGALLIGVEIKSGRPRRASGLAVFKARHPKALTVVIDYERGKKLLDLESFTPIRNDPKLLLGL